MKTLSDIDKHFLQRSNGMRNMDNFQKIPVKKKPKNMGKKYEWHFTRKLQRKTKRVIQERVYA